MGETPRTTVVLAKTAPMIRAATGVEAAGRSGICPDLQVDRSGKNTVEEHGDEDGDDSLHCCLRDMKGSLWRIGGNSE